MACDNTIPFGAATRSERVRSFQPPWHTVFVYRCSRCGHENRIRKNWSGPAPAGAFRCSG